MSHGHESGSYPWMRAVGPEIISALLWAIDPSEENTFGALVVEHFDPVAVEHTDHVTRELAGHGGPGKPQNEEGYEETACEQAWHALARGPRSGLSHTRGVRLPPQSCWSFALSFLDRLKNSTPINSRLIHLFPARVICKALWPSCGLIVRVR